MIERVIENWLISVNERQYQLPFCQLLAAEGETIVQISSHGASEQGKDVISIGKDGIPRAYQLRNGSLTLPRWREIRPQIVELVEYGIRHPAVPARAQHYPYLVISGDANAPTVQAINSDNDAWRRRRFKSLKLIQKGDLLSRFQKVHGSFLPKEPIDFRLFLELVLRDGKEPLQKEKLSQFLEFILPLTISRPSGQDATRPLASSVLLASYILRSADVSANHWALFEEWTLMAAYVLALATRHQLAVRRWKQSFELCELGARRALEALCEECQNRPNLVEGNPMADGYFYGARKTLLLGLLSALDLYLRCRRARRPNADFIAEFVESNFPTAQLWGESAIPYLFQAALAIEARGRHNVAESRMCNAIRTIAERNARELGRGFPNPYWGPEQCVRLESGLEPEAREDFRGHSYTVDRSSNTWLAGSEDTHSQPCGRP